MPNLAQTQALFWRLIRAPEGVEALKEGLGEDHANRERIGHA